MWFGDRWEEDLDPNKDRAPRELEIMGMETIFISQYVCVFDVSSKEKIKRWSWIKKPTWSSFFHCFSSEYLEDVNQTFDIQF